MRIITSFEALDIEESYLDEIQNGTADMDSIREMVFEAIEVNYDYNCYNQGQLSNHFEEDNFIFGAIDADRMRQIVSDWNMEIKRQFMKALKSIWKEGMTAEDLPMDTLELYDVWATARELGNSWWYDAEHAVYLPNEQGFSYFRVTLSESRMAEILQNPEKFIVVNVCVR